MMDFPLPAMVDPAQLKAEIEAVVGHPVTVTRDGNRVVFENVYDIVGVHEQVAETIRNHRPADLNQFDQLVSKAQRVWAGDDTFTVAQVQKILAGLVLIVARRLR